MGQWQGAPDAAFDAIQLVEVHLDRPLPRLDIERDGRRYRRVRCLVRRGSRPVGTVSIDLDDGGCSPVELAAIIRRELGAAAERRADGREPARAATNPLPLVSVVIPTCGRPDQLARCLSSALGCGYPNFEVIVVDNASDDESARDVVRGLRSDRVRCVREDRPGRSWARNRGLAEAAGAIVAFADDDVVIDSHWLDAIVEAFASAEDVGCVTGLILPLELETAAQVWIEEWGGFDKGYSRRVFDLDENRPDDPLFPYAAGTFGSGASMAFDTAVLRELGGFDVALGSGSPGCGGEELVAFFKVIDSGRKLVYEPAAIVHHPHHRDYEGLRRQIFAYGEGLSAYLTACIVDDPRRVFAIAARAAIALRYLLSPHSPKNARKPADFPVALTRAELRGTLVGPVAYLRGRRTARRIRREHGPLELALHNDPPLAGAA